MEPADNPAVQPLDEVGWLTVLLVCCAVTSLLVIIVVCALYLISNRNKQRKKHNFGVKKTRNADKGFLNFKKSSPVANPDRGSHYLKTAKSPSPTGSRSPPGCEEAARQEEAALSPATEDFHLKGAASPQLILKEATDTNDNVGVPGTRALGEENEASVGLGKLYFTIKYSFEKTALIVTVNKCNNLPAKDSSANTSDPYVKLQLLPEKQHKVKTRVLRRTTNPVYDEDFTFYGVNFNQLPILTLHFVVLSFDRYSRDDVIGEVMVEMENLELKDTEISPLSLVREIAPRSMKLKDQGRGEILVSVCFQPAAARITVVVLKARNLPKMDITGLSDPYVKIYLLHKEQRISKKKTHVKKRTLNPVFNESFVFDLPRPNTPGTETCLTDLQLEFALLDWDRVTKNEVIGRLSLGGAQCEGSALHHWQEIQASPRRQIAEWHKLKE